MIEGTINGKLFAVPESFEEFTDKHWRLFVRIMTDYRNPTWDDIRMKFIMKLLKLPERRLLLLSISNEFRDQEEFEEHMSKIALFASKLTFFENPQVITTRNVFPVVKRGFFRRRFYGPSNLIGNVGTWEYSLAETAADEYMTSNDDEALNRLFAVLYRPRKPFWPLLRFFGADPADPRMKFFDENIDKYMRQSKRISRAVKLYNYFHFQSARSMFPTEFPALYAQKKESDESADNAGWRKIIGAFAGTVPGDEEKTGRTNIWWMMERMDSIAAEADRLKEAQKAGKEKKDV